MYRSIVVVLAAVLVAGMTGMAMADARACSCTSTVATYPYWEDFEAGMGLWENVDGDDFDWEEGQGSTPSSDTGPDVDHTLGTEQGHYLFTEASEDNNPYKTAILSGPCLDLAALSAPQLSFWYSMAGDHMGSMYLEVSGDDCATWDLVFERDGHQGYEWNLAVVNLAAYAGQTIAVRITGVTGEGPSSDMAIDDIYVGEAVIYDGGCCGLDTGDCLGLMTEADCAALGNTAWYVLSDCSEDNFCPQPPPANDLCMDAIVIGALPFTDWNVDYRWATSDLPVSCDDEMCDESGYGVWYTYTPTDFCGARVHVESNGGGAHFFVAAFSGNYCGDLTEVSCSGEQENWNEQESTFNMEGGTTYWILVGNFACESEPYPTINISFNCSLGGCCLGQTCSLETAKDCDDAAGYYFGDDTTCEPDACLYGACCTSNGCEMLTESECAAAEGDFHNYGVECELDTCPPINETCDTAILVTDGAPAAQGDTTLASYDDDTEASCEDYSDKDLWYAYTAPVTGTVAVDTEGSELWSTILSVWDECGGEEIACAADGPSGSLAALEFGAIAGETYYIRFASYWGENGMFQINIGSTEAEQGACCFGDACTIDYQLTCEANGGAYGGDGTACPGDDCNGNGVEDICDVVNEASPDCNENRVPDECDINDGTSFDRDANDVPDECDPDCNENGINDGCDVTCDGGCGELADCGWSYDCQGDGVPDECQLEGDDCGGVRYDTGYADFANAVLPDGGWAHYGIADDFTLDEDTEGTCFRFDIFDHADSGSLPVMQVRIFENYDGLMELGNFWDAVPVFDQTYSVDDGTLTIIDTGEDYYYYDLLRVVASGTDWSLSEGDYAIHLTFPETYDAGFWATAGTDDSECAVFWGEWWSWPEETCNYGGVDYSRLSFALLGPENKDINDNGIPDECEVYLDIKPGSCPNSFNRTSHGVLPVALVGSDVFDVTQVDLGTVQLSRADGVGGSVAPYEGPPGPHTVYADVATPFDGDMCDCHELEGDGVLDLSMKFKTDDVVAGLVLDEFDPGALVELVLTGNLLDGTPISVSDCVRLVPPGTPPGLVTLQSNAVGSWIGVAPLDLQLDGGGFADFERSYPLSSVVTLTALSSYQGKRFIGWRLDGEFQPTGVSTDLTIAAEQHTCEAILRWPGDVDGDDDVDLNDFAMFAACFGVQADGASGCAAESWAASDLDGDRDVDLSDFATFATYFDTVAD